MLPDAQHFAAVLGSSSRNIMVQLAGRLLQLDAQQFAAVLGSSSRKLRCTDAAGSREDYVEPEKPKQAGM